MKELKLDDLVKVAGGGGECGYDKDGGGKGGKGPDKKPNGSKTS